MSQHIDYEFINKISYKLEKFSWKSNTLANFRCPICGDSQKKKNKCRGFFYIRGHQFNFMCHNCLASMSFQNFLKENEPELYKDYLIEKLKDSGKPVKQNVQKKRIEPSFYENKYDMVHVSELDTNHPARKYLKDRKIPTSYVYYVEHFFSWGSQNYPDKFKESAIDHPRIIFPAYDSNRMVIGHICRSIDGTEPKYYTLKLKQEFVFGLQRIDYKKPVYIVEGPIDSLFLPNCVAACSSALHRVPLLEKCKKILIPDNQPRNKEIVKLLGKFIDEGNYVVIWPENVEYKDINEMIQNGYSSEQILDIINKNTYSGVEAIIRYNQWRKI